MGIMAVWYGDQEKIYILSSTSLLLLWDLCWTDVAHLCTKLDRSRMQSRAFPSVSSSVVASDPFLCSLKFLFSVVRLPDTSPLGSSMRILCKIAETKFWLRVLWVLTKYFKFSNVYCFLLEIVYAILGFILFDLGLTSFTGLLLNSCL